MTRSTPTLIVVTGIQAAGKSTVARLLAERLTPGVHVEADALQKMIVSGRVWVTEPGEPRGEAARQLRLRLKNACLLARSFLDAGFNTVLDDIIIGDRYAHLQEDLAGTPFTLVVLAPRPDIVHQQRDPDRNKQPLGEEWAHYLDSALRDTITGLGLWLDTSDQTPEETVDEIVTTLDLR